MEIHHRIIDLNLNGCISVQKMVCRFLALTKTLFPVLAFEVFTGFHEFSQRPVKAEHHKPRQQFNASFILSVGVRTNSLPGTEWPLSPGEWLKTPSWSSTTTHPATPNQAEPTKKKPPTSSITSSSATTNTSASSHTASSPNSPRAQSIQPGKAGHHIFSPVISQSPPLHPLPQFSHQPTPATFSYPTHHSVFS